MIEKVLDAIRKVDRPEVSVACLGLAFKADIDDLRESPAMQVTESLSALENVNVVAVEPNINNLGKDYNFSLVNLDEALAGANILVFLVEHRQFKEIEKSSFSNKIIIDACQIFK